MIIAGDVGGTKTLLSFYKFSEENPNSRKNTISDLEIVHTEKYESIKYNSLEEIVEEFITTYSLHCEVACFGVPGPVIEGVVKATNLPWKISENNLETVNKIRKVKLVNDLQAVAVAIPYLNEDDVYTLNRGIKHDLSKLDTYLSVVIAPGTGLGQATLCTIGGKSYSFPSEGGHIDFAPRNQLEEDLLNHLLKRLKRVSLERILAGPGIINVYNFLRDTNVLSADKNIEEKFLVEDISKAITEGALISKDPLCVKTLDMFTSILGSHAGNMALLYMPQGGVYLGGGIPPKIIEKLTDGQLLKEFVFKGRLSSVVEETPLYIIKDDKCAVTGASHIAKLLL